MPGKGTQMASFRHTDGILFGASAVKENLLQDVDALGFISLAEEMATKPGGEFALLSGRKDRGQDSV